MHVKYSRMRLMSEKRPAVMVKRGRRAQERSTTHVCNFMLFDEFACMCHLHV